MPKEPFNEFFYRIKYLYIHFIKNFNSSVFWAEEREKVAFFSVITFMYPAKLITEKYFSSKSCASVYGRDTVAYLTAYRT